MLCVAAQMYSVGAVVEWPEVPKGASQMVTQESADISLQRIALASLLYYPEIGIDDPAYRLEGEVEWCLEELDPGDKDVVRDLATRTIVNPTGHRTELFTLLMKLAPISS
jgi:hypothetical protein